MEKKTFSIKEAYKVGWQTMRENMGFLVGLTIVWGIIQIVPNAVPEEYLERVPLLLSVPFIIIAIVLGILTYIGFIKIILHLLRKEEARFSELFTNWPLFWRFFAVLFLESLAIMGGFVFLIIPGIIMAVRLQFAVFLLVDQNTRIRESLNKSFTLTKGNFWRLIGFSCVGGLMNLGGALCLLVGLLFTIPATMIAMAYVYQKLCVEPIKVAE